MYKTINSADFTSNLTKLKQSEAWIPGDKIPKPRTGTQPGTFPDYKAAGQNYFGPPTKVTQTNFLELVFVGTFLHAQMRGDRDIINQGGVKVNVLEKDVIVIMNPPSNFDQKTSMLESPPVVTLRTLCGMLGGHLKIAYQWSLKHFFSQLTKDSTALPSLYLPATLTGLNFGSFYSTLLPTAENAKNMTVSLIGESVDLYCPAGLEQGDVQRIVEDVYLAIPGCERFDTSSSLLVPIVTLIARPTSAKFTLSVKESIFRDLVYRRSTLTEETLKECFTSAGRIVGKLGQPRSMGKKIDQKFLNLFRSNMK